MCGRYYLTVKLNGLLKRFGIEDIRESDPVNGEIFPSQKAPVIFRKKKITLESMTWGFSPPFMNKLLINARGETVDSRKTFKNSFLHKRCLIPASGFYEWEKLDNKKRRYRIYLRDEPVFSLAGIYDEFIADDGTAYHAFTIITTASAPELRSIHNRMPVIIRKSEENAWLDRDNSDYGRLKQMLVPYHGEKLTVKADRNSGQLQLDF